MENLSVKTKILLLAGIMLVITCIVAGVGVFANQKAKLSLDGMYNYNLMTTQYLNDANNQLRGIDVDVSYILQQDFTTDNRKVLLVDRCGGQPLGDDDGPLRLIAPEESRPARWVRQVQSITVVTAP